MMEFEAKAKLEDTDPRDIEERRLRITICQLNKRIALLEAELAAAKDAWIDKELYAKKENSK